MTMTRNAIFVRILVFLTSAQVIYSISSNEDHVENHRREIKRNHLSSSSSNVFIKDDSSSTIHSTRIVGGSNVRQNRFPYYVLLRAADTKLCGGALIAPDVVVTAAHCTDKLWAEVGRTNVRNSRDNFESFSVVAEHPHPYYSKIGKLFDRALLKLSGPSSNPVVYVNQDPAFPPNDGRFNLTTMGFGTVTDASNFLPANLQEANLEYFPNGVCAQKKNDEIEYDGLIERDMLCAGDNGVGVCRGDSGGPIVAPDDAGDVLVGLVSWGISPCGALPGVFSRLSEDYKWLRDTVCEISDYPPSEFECPSKAPSIAPSPQIVHPKWRNTTTMNESSSASKTGWYGPFNHLYIWSGLVWATMLRL